MDWPQLVTSVLATFLPVPFALLREPLPTTLPLHYNRFVPLLRQPGLCVCLLLLGAAGAVPALSAPPQAPPAPSAARMLLLPRRAVAGERATLAVLDISGRLTPGVLVTFSGGTSVKTDATGRAAFAVPASPGVASAALAGRPDRAVLTVVPAPPKSATAAVRSVPRFAALTDRFEITGNGFCGTADANRVSIGGQPALVLAASSLALTLLPPDGLAPGPALVAASCDGRALPPFSLTFLALELLAGSATLAPGERRELLVRIEGTRESVPIEARNLAPEIAALTGGNPVRQASSGGAENAARFELTGLARGGFLISIRLASPYTSPRPEDRPEKKKRTKKERQTEELREKPE